MNKIKSIFDNEYVRTILMVIAITVIADWFIMHFTVIVLDTSAETEETLDKIKATVFILAMGVALFNAHFNKNNRRGKLKW